MTRKFNDLTGLNACKSVEECDAFLREKAPWLMTYEIKIWTTRWGAHKLECNSEDDARDLARGVAKYLRARLGDEPKYTETSYWFEWTIEVWGMITSQPDFDDYGDYRNRPAPRRRFVCSFESGKERVAHPTSRVFFVVSGRDCDGYYGEELFEADNFETAQQLLDSAQENADGPQGWSCITKDEFETRRRD